jgi:hypothetical protein
MLWIFFLIVIFILLQKNAFGLKKFKFHALKNKCTFTLWIGLEIDLIRKCHDILGQRGPGGFEKVVHNILLGMLAWVFEFGT